MWAAKPVAIIALTVLLYIPVWLAVGTWLYPHTHPDYWVWAGPSHILPISAVIASLIVALTHWIKNHR